VDTGLTKATTTGLSAFASSEVEASSSDGVMVSLSIIYRKDLALDGSHPTLLNVYGAYGVSITPDFRPEALAWLERGGVLAYGHVRGGGEKGEKWHREGMLAKKQNSIDDTVACAQYLIAQNYTSAKCLAVEGTSAGGIAAGGAIVQHPELFRAGVIRGGVLDLLRFEQTQGGSANIPEFGSVKTLEGFRSLQQVSPYANVKSGTAYPAILLEAGVNDSRVPMWQSAKMTAKLQAATSSTLPILLRVDRGGGHYLGSVKGPLIDSLTDKYTFLIWHLCPDKVPRSVDPER
jgi:prolyl oligopeptidase